MLCRDCCATVPSTLGTSSALRGWVSLFTYDDEETRGVLGMEPGWKRRLAVVGALILFFLATLARGWLGSRLTGAGVVAIAIITAVLGVVVCWKLLVSGRDE